MRDSLHNNEFEDFLHKQVSNHRMYPADQIWRNIQKEIHGEGKWPALTYISIFIITALSVCTLMVKPEERLHKNTIVYPSQTEEKVVETSIRKNQNAVTSAPVQYAYTDNITQQTIQSVSDFLIARDEKENNLQPLVISKESLLSIQNEPARNNDIIPLNSTEEKATSKPEPPQLNANIVIQENKADEAITNYAASKPASRYFSTFGLINPSDLNRPSDEAAPYNSDDAWRNFPLLSTKDILRKKLSKLSFQFYIAPSVSYRRLNDGNGKTARSYTALPRTASYHLDVNHVVEHRPGMGAETGFALGYKITNTLTVKGGFQFNVRQYSIKAYIVPVAQPSADALAGNIASSNLPDEQAVADNSYLTSANNAVTSEPVVLNNRYYEIAAPIGIDWRMATFGNGRLTLNAAAALQPTYTFDKEPFIITTDYKNYTDGASIMHNWNLNSNIETYISYQMGTFRWQLGPQFRFQHFSTYSNAYPIREHLLDYGLKIGFTKSLN